MGLRPLLGPPCIPPEAPRWGFPVSTIPRGLRGFCSGSFLASLGDLPARRAMPAYAFALNEKSTPYEARLLVGFNFFMSPPPAPATPCLRNSAAFNTLPARQILGELYTAPH